jgi:hypothetical protein
MSYQSAETKRRNNQVAKFRNALQNLLDQHNMQEINTLPNDQMAGVMCDMMRVMDRQIEMAINLKELS